MCKHCKNSRLYFPFIYHQLSGDNDRCNTPHPNPPLNCSLSALSIIFLWPPHRCSGCAHHPSRLSSTGKFHHIPPKNKKKSNKKPSTQQIHITRTVCYAVSQALRHIFTANLIIHSHELPLVFLTFWAFHSYKHRRKCAIKTLHGLIGADLCAFDVRISKDVFLWYEICLLNALYWNIPPLPFDLSLRKVSYQRLMIVKHSFGKSHLITHTIKQVFLYAGIFLFSSDNVNGIFFFFSPFGL